MMLLRHLLAILLLPFVVVVVVPRWLLAAGAAVALMLAGQALFWGSYLVAAWAAVFVLANHVYFVASEEPGLERRFGEAYRPYRANVPRWLPRLRPTI